MTRCSATLALLLLLAALPRAGAGPRPRPVEPVEQCRPEQIRNVFSDSAPSSPSLSPSSGRAQGGSELRILVTCLAGANRLSQALGCEAGVRIRAALETYARDHLTSAAAGLPAHAIRVGLVRCKLADHEQARRLGSGVKADAVLWGSAVCSTAKNPRPVVNPNVSIGNGITITGSPQARVEARVRDLSVHITSNMPDEVGQLTTSLTAVGWHGLEANALRTTEVKRCDQFSSLDLQALVPEDLRSQLDTVLGLYAARTDRHGLAAELFRRTAKDVAAGVTGSADLYRTIGTSYVIAGYKDYGLASLDKALRSCGSAASGCTASMLHSLGWAHERLGDKEKARTHFESAQHLWKELHDGPGEARALNGLGLVYHSLGNQQQALSLLAQAAALRKAAGDPLGEAATLSNLGLVHSARGEKEKARTLLEQALKKWQEAGSLSGEAAALSNLGGVYYALADKPRAQRAFEQTLTLRQTTGDVLGEANTRGNLALIHRDYGQMRDAVHSFQAAAGCYLRSSPPDLERAVRSLDLALALSIRNRLSPEVQKLSELLKTHDPDELRRLRRQAGTAGQMKWESAESLYQQLAARAGALPEKEQATLLTFVQAGLVRAQQRASWPECPGLLITRADPDASHLSLALHVGDIVLRSQGRCLFEPGDLLTAADKVSPDQTVKLELWRAGASEYMTLPLSTSIQRGWLGFTPESF